MTDGLHGLLEDEDFAFFGEITGFVSSWLKATDGLHPPAWIGFLMPVALPPW
ncbi:hypothetical protein ACDY96_18905 [Rhizobium mongolense]|uniref:hypothetical protein n=1 Tax=Rhizobium mongolense TaxID=57676 RepID=UPI003558B07B